MKVKKKNPALVGIERAASSGSARQRDGGVVRKEGHTDETKGTKDTNDTGMPGCLGRTPSNSHHFFRATGVVPGGPSAVD